MSNGSLLLTEGRVEKIPFLPGTSVGPETVIMILSNPELELELLDAKSAFHGSEAEYLSLVAQLDSSVLAQQSVLAAITSESKQAELQLEVDRRLAEKNLIADLDLRLSEVRVTELKSRLQIEMQRLDADSTANNARLRAQESHMEQARALYEHRLTQVSELQVKAGLSGVIQQIPLQIGQRVMPGENIALIVDTSQLIARVRIPETQANEIHLGQEARIDLRTAVVEGVVGRIDPAVVEATVSIDLAFADPLPNSARPDMNVDGLVEIDKLSDVVFVNRPALAQSGMPGTMFRIDTDMRSAVRVSVNFGQASFSEIEVTSGLVAGDRVIISDVSRWDHSDRLNLN